MSYLRSSWDAAATMSGNGNSFQTINTLVHILQRVRDAVHVILAPYGIRGTPVPYPQREGSGSQWFREPGQRRSARPKNFGRSIRVPLNVAASGFRARYVFRGDALASSPDSSAPDLLRNLTSEYHQRCNMVQ